MSESQTKEFYTDFEAALDFLGNEKNYELLEEFMHNYLASNAEQSYVKFINHQVELQTFLGRYFDPIMHFLKTTPAIEFNGPNQTTYSKLKRLWSLSHMHYTMIENVITTPNKLKANMFSYSEDQPDMLKMTLINNDNTKYDTYFDFNGGMLLINAMFQHLNNKIMNGRNNFNTDIFEELNRLHSVFYTNLAAELARIEDES